MADMEWVKLDGCFFEQTEKMQLTKGFMTIEEAKQKVEADPSNAIGICVQGDGEDDGQVYCSVAKMGSERYSGEGFTCLVYKVVLPEDDGNLFEDDFADTDDAGVSGNTWARPGRGDGFADSCRELNLFKGISPNDLSQGGMGDCWLISAFAAMAEFPEAIMACFDKKTLDPDGHYGVTLYDFTQKRMVRLEIDDRLPVNGSKAAYVAPSDDGEIWPCLLEKAFAKLCSGYQSLDGGLSIFAFGAMTGCTELTYCSLADGAWSVTNNVSFTENSVMAIDFPQAETNYQSPSMDEFLQMMQQWDAQNYVMCAGSHDGQDTNTNASGIVQGHAYSVLQVKVDVCGSGVNLVQLRNPWGHKEWAGDWSDQSDLWDEHADMAEELGHIEEDDGAFWMTFEDFCDNYIAVFVCKKNMGENRGKAAVETKKKIELTGEEPLPRNNPAIAVKRKQSGVCSAGCPMC